MRRMWLVVVMLGFGCGPSASADGAASADALPSAEASAKASAKAGAAPSPAPPLPEPELLEPLGEPEPEGPPVRVTLPPAPDLALPDVPVRYPDGSVSIAGLREDLDASVGAGDAGKEVVIKAWVTKIYVPPECPEGEVCPPAKQPHLWVTDTAEERGLANAMLVVNYQFAIPEWEATRWEGQPEVVLELGKRYAFKGKFRLFSDTGFAHDQGLLEFLAVRDLDAAGTETGDWVIPPGAPWHPMEIARQEDEERKLKERLSKPR